PLSFLLPHPGGMNDNSPTFQGWIRTSKNPSPEGTAEQTARIKGFEHPVSAVPSGLGFFVRMVPTLKHWAILSAPSGRCRWRENRVTRHSSLLSPDSLPSR